MEIPHAEFIIVARGVFPHLCRIDSPQPAMVVIPYEERQACPKEQACQTCERMSLMLLLTHWADIHAEISITVVFRIVSTPVERETTGSVIVARAECTSPIVPFSPYIGERRASTPLV